MNRAKRTTRTRAARAARATRRPAASTPRQALQAVRRDAMLAVDMLIKRGAALQDKGRRFAVARVRPHPAAVGGGSIEDLWLYLHLMLEAIWEYRFLHRDLDDLLGRNRRLRDHFARIVERQYEVVVALCEGLVRARAMQARPADIRTLARNVLLVATYWLSFRALRAERGSHDAELGRGAYQVMSLVAPYLVGDARQHMERLSSSYLE